MMQHKPGCPSGDFGPCDCKKPPKNFFGQEIEPKALCRNCEYYDGGGLKPNGDPLQESGDCHNPRSDRLQTVWEHGCRYFFPCSTRWPDADHG